MSETLDIFHRIMAIPPIFKHHNLSVTDQGEGYQLEHYRCFINERLLQKTPRPLIFIHIDGAHVGKLKSKAITSEVDNMVSSSSMITIVSGRKETHWQANGIVNFLYIEVPDSIALQLLTLFKAGIEHVTFSDPISYAITLELLKQLKTIIGHQSVAKKEIYLTFLLQSFTTQLLHSMTHVNDKASSKKTDEINKVLEYIDINLGKKLTIKQLAQVSHFSSSHFRHIFSEMLGQTPHQYILEQRLVRSQQLLIHTNLASAVIAEDLGFSSQSHFNSTFSKKYGISPVQYRKQTTL